MNTQTDNGKMRIGFGNGEAGIIEIIEIDRALGKRKIEQLLKNYQEEHFPHNYELRGFFNFLNDSIPYKKIKPLKEGFKTDDIIYF